MLRNKQYTVYVIADAKADLKKISVKRRSIIAMLSCSALLLLLIIFLTYHYCKTYNYSDTLANLKSENTRLISDSKLLNNSLLKVNNEMRFVNSRMEKLANMVGVEQLTSYSEGGGFGGFDNPDENIRISRRTVINSEINLLENKGKELQSKLSTLEGIYKDKFEILGYTPSIWPVKGILTHGFGWRKDPFTGKPDYHQALDISARRGTSIVAPADGTVIEVKASRGYGKTVILSHGFGLTTRYAHLDSYNVKKGQKVKRGDVIAFLGSTGRSTGPHLHYEVRLDGKAVDPMKYMVEDRRSKY